MVSLQASKIQWAYRRASACCQIFLNNGTFPGTTEDSKPAGRYHLYFEIIFYKTFVTEIIRNTHQVRIF